MKKVYRLQILRQRYDNNVKSPNKNVKYRKSYGVFLDNRQIASYRYIKKDLPKRTGPFTYIRVMIYSSTAACAAAN